MFKVSRKSEYALIAIQHLARRARDGVTSVAELAQAENIPPDILAKVLQGLKRAGLLTAAKGAGGARSRRFTSWRSCGHLKSSCAWSPAKTTTAAANAAAIARCAIR